MRKAHYIRPNKRSETVHYIISVDTETEPVPQPDGSTENRLVLGVALLYHRQKSGKWGTARELVFRTPDELWEWFDVVLRPKRRYVLLAHYWPFDAQVLGAFRQFPSRGWEMGLAVIDGPPWLVTWRRNGCRIDMLDTMNWLPGSVRAIGEGIALPKLEVEFGACSDGELVTYCRRDAEIPAIWLQRWCDWLRDNDLGGFAMTAAGQAFRTWRHRFMAHQVLIDDDSRALALSREAYSGGRCECFRIGEIAGPLTLLDVSSMYPYVMRGREFPTKLINHVDSPTQAELAEWLPDYCVTAAVEIETESPAYAVRRNGRLIFPVGTFRAVLTSPELKRALERGEIRRIEHAAIYERGAIFEEFVTYFWQLRNEYQAEDNDMYDKLAKLVMNSLYGKFGQRGMVWETIADAPDLEVGVMEVVNPDTEERQRFRQLGGKIQEFVREGESRESHPAVAAHVTAHARLYLYELMETAGRSNVYYVDTDSLLVNAEGLARLEESIRPGVLGLLKVEGEFRSVTLHGPKDYVMGSRTKIKGVRKSAEQLGPAHYRQERLRSMVGAVAAGEINRMVVTTTEKKLRRVYLKGVVSADGSVEPFRLPVAPGESLSTRAPEKCQQPAALSLWKRALAVPLAALVHLLQRLLGAELVTAPPEE